MSNEFGELEEAPNPGLSAVGDQVQAVAENAGISVILTVLVSEDGTVDVRSPLPYEVIKGALFEVAESF